MSMRNGLVKITNKINPKFYGKKLSTYINSKIPKLRISHISQGNLPTPTLNKKNNFICTKCGVRTIKIKNKNNDLLPKFIILATKNSCCY
jgi:predicted methyltransferase